MADTDLPTLCSTHDHGGGANYNSTFLVYTTTTVPSSLHPLCLTPPASLCALASTVAEKVPIHFTLDGELVSLPCPPLYAGREVDRLPWFFINAAGCFGHGIAGRGSTVETLLAVLRRPWCVLELCCTPVYAVESLLAFAECAAEFDHVGYGAAVTLLRHELAAREEEDAKKVSGPTVEPNRTSASISALRTMCCTVFSTSVRSYNGFWLRLVCVSALQLGISYSRLGLLLNGTHGGDLTALSGVRRWRNREPEHRLKKAGTVLERGKWGRKADDEDKGLPSTKSKPKEVLLWVYARVLERIANEVF